jgi:hypothetical protein
MTVLSVSKMFEKVVWREYRNVNVVSYCQLGPAQVPKLKNRAVVPGFSCFPRLLSLVLLCKYSLCLGWTRYT